MFVNFYILENLEKKSRLQQKMAIERRNPDKTDETKKFGKDSQNTTKNSMENKQQKNSNGNGK